MEDDGLQNPQRSAKAFKIKNFNLTLTNPNLKADNFVRGFNQTIRTEFFIRAQAATFHPRSNQLMNLQEFPANTLLRNYLTQKKENSIYGATLSKKNRKEMLEDKKDHPYIDLQLAENKRPGQKTPKIIPNYFPSYLVSPKHTKLSGKGGPNAAKVLGGGCDTYQPLSKSMPKFNQDRKNASGKQSIMTLDRNTMKSTDYFDLRDDIKDDAKKEKENDPGYSFGMGNVKRADSQSSDEERPKSKLGSPRDEQKSIAIREVVKSLNKKLDSFRGHGNGSALVRNLLRNMGKQAGTLGLIENKEILNLGTVFQKTKKSMSPSNKLVTDSKPNGSDFLTRLSNIKIESRDQAFRSSEQSIKQMLKNKKHLPRFDKPKVVLNVDELLDSPGKRIIDNLSSMNRRNKMMASFSPDKYQSANLVFFDHYPQGFAHYPRTLKDRISDLMDERTLRSQRSVQGFAN